MPHQYLNPAGLFHHPNYTRVLTVEKLRHKAEATVMLRGSKIYADATDGNMYAAIDALADKLDRCVKKHKEKVSDHHAEEVIRDRSSS